MGLDSLSLVGLDFFTYKGYIKSEVLYAEERMQESSICGTDWY